MHGLVLVVALMGGVQQKAAPVQKTVVQKTVVQKEIKHAVAQKRTHHVRERRFRLFGRRACLHCR